MCSKVYFIPANCKEEDEKIAKKTKKIFLKLGLDQKIDQNSLVGLKIHFGEEGNQGYIEPPWLIDLIQFLKKKTSTLFLTDTSTLYTGKRSNAVHHHHLAWKHGFRLKKLGIPVIFSDGLIGRDDEEIEVNLSRVKKARIARGFVDADSLICLSHFTGHVLTGFGAALKNMGMGCASRAGKLDQHSDVHPRVDSTKCKICSLCFDVCPTEAIVEKDQSAFIIDEKCIGCGECLVVCRLGAIKTRWDPDNSRVQEKMVEYAYTATKLFKEKIGFINFLLKITQDCDCMSKKGNIITKDIGIVASLDPVAVDKASVDLIMTQEGKDVLKEVIGVDWSVQLQHAQDIGMGSTEYELEKLK